MTSTPEQAARAESVDLAYSEGTADKVYRLRLEKTVTTGPCSPNGAVAVRHCRAA
jgi:hypothetical protein